MEMHLLIDCGLVGGHGCGSRAMFSNAETYQDDNVKDPYNNVKSFTESCKNCWSHNIISCILNYLLTTLFYIKPRLPN